MRHAVRVPELDIVLVYATLSLALASYLKLKKDHPLTACCRLLHYDYRPERHANGGLGGIYTDSNGQGYVLESM